MFQRLKFLLTRNKGEFYHIITWLYLRPRYEVRHFSSSVSLSAHQQWRSAPVSLSPSLSSLLSSWQVVKPTLAVKEAGWMPPPWGWAVSCSTGQYNLSQSLRLRLRYIILMFLAQRRWASSKPASIASPSISATPPLLLRSWRSRYEAEIQTKINENPNTNFCSANGFPHCCLETSH